MKLKVDIKKIIKLLAKDIYDSPYALLRENLQNAYDAILMRKAKDDTFIDPCIKMYVANGVISICDNGIGMSQDVIENNYWKAGSSGKNNDEARKAGVVGTFGIGAMANFGVCQKLEVQSRYYDSDETIFTSLECDNISLEEDCIQRSSCSDAEKPIGTTVKATLNPGVIINHDEACNYLKPYVQYLNIPVYIDDILVSQRNYREELMISEANSISCEDSFDNNGFQYKLRLSARNYNEGLISVHVTDIRLRGIALNGDLVLVQYNNTIYGLRNGFGLAPVGLGSTFRWGGVANLSDIIPTAGRDSLTRESINLIASLVSSVEASVVKIFSKYEICDNNREFLSYVYQHPNMTQELASMITIRREPSADRLRLWQVKSNMDGRDVHFYPGSDESIIGMFANENNYLLVLSNNTIRKNIQQRYLSHIGINTIPDSVRANDYQNVDLEASEISVIFRIQYVLQNDYLMNNVKVFISEITHNQPVKVESTENDVLIHLQRGGKSLKSLCEIYKTDYSLFDGFIKDYVRQNLYPHLSNYVPSATRQGAEALMRIMKQKKDLFSIEEKEMGYVDEIIREYLEGKASLAQVHRVSSAAYNSQRQEVSTEFTGRVEDVVPSVQKEGADTEKQNSQQGTPIETLPQPPILRLDYETEMKLLQADSAYQALNGHKLFLALSDKLYDKYSDFFLEPHSTKVIWSTHKIVYVFTHISNKVSMYYDIDLKEPLPDNLTGGTSIVSTTIMTKNKIFVPIVSQMYDYFNLKQHSGKLEFYVRFDTLSS